MVIVKFQKLNKNTVIGASLCIFRNHIFYCLQTNGQQNKTIENNVNNRFSKFSLRNRKLMLFYVYWQNLVLLSQLPSQHRRLKDVDNATVIDVH